VETVFTPLASLAGGALIGCAAVLLMLVHGRVAGATGILAGFLLPEGGAERSWRGAMLAGMASAPVAWLLTTGTMPTVDVPIPMLALAGGGVIVGIGVTLANGCTSGHGVCGNARLSPRSIAATLTFMLTAGITVYVIRHVIGN